MKTQKILCLALTALGLASPQLGYSETTHVQVHVLSRFSLHEVTASATGPLKVFKNGIMENPLILSERKDLKIRMGTQGLQVDLLPTEGLDKITLQVSEGLSILLKTPDGQKRRFQGTLHIAQRQGRLFLTEQVPLEKYVAGVLAAEMPDGFPLEALKAQAVLIRSYTLSHADRHRREGFNFCDLTHCQAYGGEVFGSSSYLEAVRQTKGLVLNYRGEPIEALYHSTCGGHTAANQEVFGGEALAYLQGVDDKDYCQDSPHWRWESRLPLKEIATSLTEGPVAGPVAELTSIRAVEKGDNGRVVRLAFAGGQDKSLSSEKFLSRIGRHLGWNRLKSNWFEVTLEGDQARFKGRGLGHGVGLCQWGARGMALAGKGFEEILAHYFPGTRLSRYRAKEPTR